MMAGETGEELVKAMSAMQAKKAGAEELLKKVASHDRAELASAFEAAARAQETASEVRLAVGLACLLSVTLLSFWLGRGTFRALAQLTAGFARFGKGGFSQPVPVVSPAAPSHSPPPPDRK